MMVLIKVRISISKNSRNDISRLGVVVGLTFDSLVTKQFYYICI